MAGAATVAWIIVQLAFIREVSFFHPLYAAIGVASIAILWGMVWGVWTWRLWR